MSLPNPHGNASGQIAHNSIYDTGVTPGSTGGKFIGFGEEGTSYITNRANWALSENIDYVYQILAADRAIPAGASFTSAGQNTYQITDDVWVGDSGYPISEAEGLLMLFAVTDEQYNELTDGSGNEVRVAIVRDSTNVTNVYKNDGDADGFEPNPVITFKTVDSSGVDVQNPYTIPAAQEVRVLYGALASFEALPTDALVKFKLQSATEVEAGAFLQDGTKKMTGDADWDEHRLLNPLEVRGAAGQDLLIRSQQHLLLYADESLKLKDQNTPSEVFVSNAAQGGTEVEGYHNSILSSLNSKSAITGAYFGNKLLSRTGSLTFTDGTGQVGWPTLTALIDGERRVITAGSYVATSGSLFIAVLTSAGSVVEKTPWSVLSTDVPLAAYVWSGAAFTKKVDIRWSYNGNTRHVEITCGDATDSVDFSESELDKAVELACAMSAMTEGSIPTIRIIGRVRGPAVAAPTITLTAPISIIGNGSEHSLIFSDEVNGDTVNFIDCAGHRLVMKDLAVVHSGDQQAGTLGAIVNAGSWSVFSNVKFMRDPGTYDQVFGNALLWTMAADHVLVENCHDDDSSGNAFIMGSNAAFTTAYLTDSTIRDCYLDRGSLGGVYGVVANGDGNVISNIRITTGLSNYGFVGGNDTLIDHCRIRMTGAAASAACVFYKPIAGASHHNGLVVRDSSFLRCAGKGILADAINDVGMRARVEVRGCRFNQVSKPFDFSALVAVHATTTVLITGNEVYDSDEFIASFENVWHCQFSDNTCNTVNGDGLWIGANAGCKVLNNFFEGYGSVGAWQHIISVSVGGPWVEIRNNFFGSTGAPASTVQVDVWRKCGISGNHFVGSTNAETGIQLNSWFFFGIDLPAAVSCLVSGNFFSAHGDSCIKVGRGSATVQYYNGSTIEGNHFSGIPDTAYGVLINESDSVTICNNDFTASDGSAIRVFGNVGSRRTHITGNHFSDILGKTSNAPYGNAIVAILSGGGAKSCVVSDNNFMDCGSTTPVVSYEQSIILVDGADYVQVCNNHITGLRGGSSAADQGDSSHGIYLGPGYCDHSMVNGNYIVNDVGVAGRVADRFYGIRLEGQAISATGNRVVFFGTQSDANKSDILYGIIVGSSHTKIGLFTNYVDVYCTIAGITIQKSYYMINEFSAAVGNWGEGGDVDFQGNNKMLVGNYALTGTLLYTNNASVIPDTTAAYLASGRTPMVDINQQ